MSDDKGTLAMNVGAGPVDLASGRSLGPGESAEVDLSHPHNKALVDAGSIRAVNDKPAPERGTNLRAAQAAASTADKAASTRTTATTSTPTTTDKEGSA